MEGQRSLDEQQRSPFKWRKNSLVERRRMRNDRKKRKRHRRRRNEEKKWKADVNSEDICLQTLTSLSITWIKITRACGWQKSFRAGQILCAQTDFQHDFRRVSILEFPSIFDSEAHS